MIKKLPIAEPPIKCYQFMALPLSVIMTDPSMIKWFYSEFTQIYTCEFDNKISLRFYNYGIVEEYDVLECMRISPHQIKLEKDILELYKLFIKNNYYVYAFVDDSCITTMSVNKSRMHDILLYGFDDNKKIFNAYAYNMSELRHFTVSYSDIIKAYNSETALTYTQHLTIFYRLKDKSYSLNLSRFKWHFLDYMESVDTILRESPRCVRDKNIKWGISIYDSLKDASKSENVEIHVSNIFSLYEHKKHMLSKIEYFNNNSELKCDSSILNGLREIINKAELYYKLVLLYNANLSLEKNVTDIVKVMSDTLDEMKEKELVIFEKYYNINKNIFKLL